MIETIKNKARDRMSRSVEITKADLSSIHSGRATPALVESLTIMAYGGTQRLKLMELATITTLDARTLVIAPYDPSVLTEIEKGIMEANVGLTPVIDGELIRISIPPLSSERRQEYIKLAKAKLEAGRIMIRQVRQEAMKELAKVVDSNEVAEDEAENGKKHIQELTDEMVAEIDALGERKEQELLQV